MSVTPTPSVSSIQTRYYDALDMQFPLADDAAAEGTATGSAEPRPGAPENPSDTNELTRTEGKGSPLRHIDEEARQKAPSLDWLPVEGDDGQERHTSPMKMVFGGDGRTLARKESVRTARSTRTTGTTSAFANGAPLMGPNAELDVDESLFARSAKAERSLSQKQKDRIAKEERKETKKFSKILKTESTTEKVALGSALKTLSALQSLHKGAMKRETKAEASHARALSAAQKAESRFHGEKARAAELRARAETRCMEERARWEGKEGEVRAQQERLDSAREAVNDAEMRIAECAREVERLRIVKATDEREREAKLSELAEKM